jgi:hypothetical protein
LIGYIKILKRYKGDLVKIKISRVLDRIAILSLIVVWLMMSFGYIRENEVIISIGIALSVIITNFSLYSIEYKEDESNDINIYKIIIVTLFIFFIILAILQQIVFGWFVIAWVALTMFSVNISKKEKEIKGLFDGK